MPPEKVRKAFAEYAASYLGTPITVYYIMDGGKFTPKWDELVTDHIQLEHLSKYYEQLLAEQ